MYDGLGHYRQAVDWARRAAEDTGSRRFDRRMAPSTRTQIYHLRKVIFRRLDVTSCGQIGRLRPRCSVDCEVVVWIARSPVRPADRRQPAPGWARLLRSE